MTNSGLCSQLVTSGLPASRVQGALLPPSACAEMLAATPSLGCTLRVAVDAINSPPHSLHVGVPTRMRVAGQTEVATTAICLATTTGTAASQDCPHTTPHGHA